MAPVVLAAVEERGGPVAAVRVVPAAVAAVLAAWVVPAVEEVVLVLTTPVYT